MLDILRFTLTGLILLTAAPALAVPVFISEVHVGGGTGFLNNVVNNFDSGTNSASTSGSGNVSGAVISGSAEAVASFLQFGGRASASLTNANGIGAIRASSTSLMSDTITITSAGIADGSQGFLQYVFSIDGTLNVTNTTNTFVTASAAVAITHDFGALGGWEFRREQKAAGSQTVNEAFVFSDLIPFVYGTPFDLHFRLVTGSGVVNAPSQNFTATADFLSTLTVLDFNVFDASQDAVAQASILGRGRHRLSRLQRSRAGGAGPAGGGRPRAAPNAEANLAGSRADARRVISSTSACETRQPGREDGLRSRPECCCS